MHTVAAAAVAAGLCLAASPYLARLTRTVPDRQNKHWWRGAPVDQVRLAWTAAIALVVGALAGAAAGWTAVLPAYMALAVAGVPLVVIDYEHHRLPNRLVYPGAVSAALLLALAAAVDGNWPSYLRAVEAAAVAYASLFLLKFISPRSFGWGDVRLGSVLGAYLGYHSWEAVYYGLFAGFVFGAVVALVLMTARRASMKSALAFGPMLLFGALLELAVDVSPSLVG